MQSKINATRRSLLTLGVSAALFTPGILGAQEANWPNRPVRIIAAFPAGSGTDSLARFYGERLGRIFGQNFVIENIGGANEVFFQMEQGEMPLPVPHLMATRSFSAPFPPTLPIRI